MVFFVNCVSSYTRIMKSTISSIRSSSNEESSRNSLSLTTRVREYFILEKGRVLTLSLELLLFVFLTERIYNRTGLAGTYNVYVSLILILIGIFVCTITKVNFTKHDLSRVMLTFFFIVWGASKYSVIYGTIFFLVTVWDKLRFRDLSNFFRCLIAVGFFCDLIFNSEGRSTGFLFSAPIYAYYLCIAITYLMFQKKDGLASRLDYLFIGIGVAQIWATRTRLFMLFSVVATVFKIFQAATERLVDNELLKKILSTALIILIIFLAYNFIDQFEVIFGREGDYYSNLTRTAIYRTILPAIFESPRTFLIGHGGGFAMNTIASASSYQGNLPVHQDILMYLADYGLIGTIAIAVLFFKGNKWNCCMWLLLILGTFHNVGTTGLTMLLLFMASQSLSMKSLAQPNEKTSPILETHSIQ